MFLIILCSILGIVGALLNCLGRLKLSYVTWFFGNTGFLYLNIVSGTIYEVAMWGVYLSTTVIGLLRYRKIGEGDKA